QRAAVCVAPLVSGAGFRTKVVQYAALRRPCDATSIAVEDIALEHGREIMVADDCQSFASSVVTLLRNHVLAARMAEAAHRKAMAAYDNNAIADGAIEGLYRELDPERAKA
ncbi:MAG: glycosyltransferase, partial [Kiritimatiellae bacterium]|nr:glycosyltransferase [Kiritimatiellia bacterium]